MNVSLEPAPSDKYAEFFISGGVEVSLYDVSIRHYMGIDFNSEPLLLSCIIISRTALFDGVQRTTEEVLNLNSADFKIISDHIKLFPS